MSADDAQQNIPSGHVAKMRQAVDELNRAKRVKTAIGVAIVPVSWARGFQIVLFCVGTTGQYLPLCSTEFQNYLPLCLDLIAR